MAPAADAPSDEQVDRRRRVIDAAFELGAAGGYDAVQMRDVAVTANVALATIYRYFSSKDHLLAAAMSEWIERLQTRVADAPLRGATPADRMVDLLHRACRAMERQPQLSRALLRALASPDPAVTAASEVHRGQIAAMGDGVLAHLPAELRADLLAVIGHVWYSTLITWANGRSDFATVVHELERAARVLLEPHEAPAPG